MWGYFVAELIGTWLLILLGNGVVANVVLARTKGHGGGWIVISAGWGMAVFVAVFAVGDISGAHINPAVTFAMAIAGKLAWSLVPIYLVGQIIGAFVGGCTVYLFYRPHFQQTENRGLKLACFSTSPEVRSLPHAFISEVIGTFVLVLPIFLMAVPGMTVLGVGEASTRTVPLGLGALGALPVGLLVFAIGLSLGGTTGYAINPARDLGPRLAHALLLGRKGESSDWPYAWIPILAPLVGALIAALVYLLLVQSEIVQ